jgi:hypothetical protein
VTDFSSDTPAPLSVSSWSNLRLFFEGDDFLRALLAECESAQVVIPEIEKAPNEVQLRYWRILPAQREAGLQEREMMKQGPPQNRVVPLRRAARLLRGRWVKTWR